MQLVDKGDDLPVGLLDLVQHSLETFLELAAVLRARDHGAQIQRDQRLALQALRHVASHDAAGQALHDRSLTDARLTDEHRVVLSAAGKHLHHAADLRIAPDHRVDLALARTRGQIGGVLLQRLELVLRVVGGDLPATSNGREGLLQRVEGGAALGQKLSSVVVALRDAGQKDVGGHELVAKLAREILRMLQCRLQVPVDARVGHVLPLRAGVGANQLAGLARDGVRVHARGLEHRGGDAVLLLQERLQHVRRAHLRVAGGRGAHLRLLQGLLCLLRVLIRHDSMVLSCLMFVSH